jgi:hypothetical protein
MKQRALKKSFWVFPWGKRSKRLKANDKSSTHNIIFKEIVNGLNISGALSENLPHPSITKYPLPFSLSLRGRGAGVRVKR